MILRDLEKQIFELINYNFSPYLTDEDIKDFMSCHDLKKEFVIETRAGHALAHEYLISYIQNYEAVKLENAGYWNDEIDP